MENNTFPNGLRSWMETHFEIAGYISNEMLGEMTGTLAELYESGGTVAMYDLALSLTEEFESMHKGREWDGEFFDEVHEFVKTRTT